MPVTENDSRQDKDIATTIIRVDGLEKRVDKLEETSSNIAEAAASQTKSIAYLEKIMWGVLIAVLAGVVKLAVFGVG